MYNDSCEASPLCARREGDRHKKILIVTIDVKTRVYFSVKINLIGAVESPDN